MNEWLDVNVCIDASIESLNSLPDMVDVAIVVVSKADEFYEENEFLMKLHL